MPDKPKLAVGQEWRHARGYRWISWIGPDNKKLSWGGSHFLKGNGDSLVATFRAWIKRTEAKLEGSK